MLSSVGRSLILLGAALVALGFILSAASKISWVGRLPGDMYVRRGNWTFYAPLATGLIISLILTLALNIRKFFK
ncbi:MAG: DUF2905 domain-containing protein [Elusimicrobia bacterium]|nr:DUF2905 domain-containing protein [Elusimicrobiota bacterium]